MHDERWSERLSEYLDGGLDAAGRDACARHLESCAGCRALLEELRRVRDAARALPDVPPVRDLWPGIATRLAPRAGADPEPGPADFPRAPIAPTGGRRWWRRRFTFALPQVAAAAALLAVVAGGATWLVLRMQPARVVAERPAPAVPGTAPATADAVLAAVDPRYDRTIAELQRVLATERAHLDTSTVRILEQNLAIIDRAVEDARRAVEQDPSNAYLRSYLASAMRRKVDLLRRATVMPGAQG